MTSTSPEKEKAILEKIGLDPHFSLRLIPSSKAALSLLDAQKIMIENKVSLRGWDFPHFLPGEIANANNYVFNTVDWNRHVELWRMYLSGQFVYLGNLWDVLPEFQGQLINEMKQSIFTASPAQKETVKGVTSFIGLIYSVTEFYVFAARLASALKWADSFRVVNHLRNVEGWTLGSGDPSIIWHIFYQCQTPDIDLSRTLTVAELVADPALAASRAIQTLFAGFNWNDASSTMIRQWQDKLMSGRFAF